jgi:hypothetical protein
MLNSDEEIENQMAAGIRVVALTLVARIMDFQAFGLWRTEGIEHHIVHLHREKLLFFSFSFSGSLDRKTLALAYGSDTMKENINK